MSIRSLIEHVLDEVAIDGSDGTTIQQLFSYVSEFYTKNPVQKADISQLRCPKPRSRSPGTGESLNRVPGSAARVQPAFWGVPNLEKDFQDFIWDLLRVEEDLIVGKGGDGNRLSLGEILNDLRNESGTTGGEGAQGEGGGGSAPQQGGEGAGREWRVYAAEDRRWRTLTGHGPDPKKVPNALYRCLEVVGKHREAGLIQPELTKLTGQDKKSVAGRTTLLSNLGLIEKVSVLAKGLNTSRLTLMKYALLRDTKQQLGQRAKETATKKKGKKVLDGKHEATNLAWTGPTIDTERLIRAIIIELKAAKNQVLMHSDLKRKLGMDKSRFHWRCFSRILRKLESLGVMRRIRVPLKVPREFKKKEGSSEVAIADQCHARCIRHIRDMEDEDWRKVLTAFSKREFVMQEGEDAAEVGASDAESAKVDSAGEVDPEAVKELGRVNVGAVDETIRDPPQWRKEKPLTTLIFDIVDAAGKDGVSSMDLIYNTIGSFYYRPMDQILHRLTDYPQQSQPPQYMHLAIIRETGISGRQTHYRYFSYRWHQELVAEGVAVEPWTQAVKKKGAKRGSHGGTVEGGLGERDEYGFAPVNASRLLKEDGSAALAESQLEGKKDEKLGFLKSQFTVVKNKHGEQSLSWKNTTPRGGRPRKYEKGKEPYLEARRRNAARREAEMLARGIRSVDGVSAQSQTADQSGAGPSSPGGMSKRPRLDEQGELPPPKRRGRPPGVKNGQGVTKKTPVKKGPGKRGLGKKGPGKTAPKKALVPVSEPPGNGAADARVAVRAVEPSSVVIHAQPDSSRKRKGPEEAASPGEDPKRRKIGDLVGEGVAVAGDNGEDRSGVLAHDADMGYTGGATGRGDIEMAQSTVPSLVHVEEAVVADSPADIGVARGTELDSIRVDGAVPVHSPTVPGDTEMPQGVELGLVCVEGAMDIETPAVPVPDTDSTPSENASGSSPTALPQQEVPPRVLDGVLLEVEHLDTQGNESYGSIGGMLALSRQQVVLDLLRENNGIFPSGSELRHAFSKSYQKKNPKAGICDRRLIRGIVQSLQYKKKAYQITFDFSSSRGILITKKILVDSSLSPDSPLVDAMVREMIAADGNLWFPPNTELHEDIQERFSQPPSWSLPKPRDFEDVEFDRVYPTSISELKRKRAARALERAAAKAAKLAAPIRPRGRPRIYDVSEIFRMRRGGKFTDKQRTEAARRKAEINARKVRQKMSYGRHSRSFARERRAPPVRDEDDEPLPGTWWSEFIEKDRTKPQDEETFLQEIHDVEKWEKRLEHGLDEEVRGNSGGFLMINHFAPPTEKGDNFVQVPVSDMDNRIPAPDFSQPPRIPSRKRGPKPRAKDPKKDRGGGIVDVLMGEPRLRRKRRLPGTYEKPQTRRDRAMAAIRENNLKPYEEDVLKELPPRRFQFRNQFLIPKEDEETLLIGIIIVRTLFGGWERRIEWDLLRTALPHHPVKTLQRRWPRVREIHKAHMPKLQAEFEEMYLEAYSAGRVPPVDPVDPSAFDLPFHVKWFRENLELPEGESIPELPATRETFDALYDIHTEIPTSWRDDFHNPIMTMGNRINRFLCQTYEVPLEDKKPTDEDDAEVEYIKSVIKANIVTDGPGSDPKTAFEILHSCAEETVDTAFNKLSSSKTISHKKKDHARTTPGPNYEFTDKFHFSLRTPMDESLYAQAVGYEYRLFESFAKNEAVEVSPLASDGSMACIFAMIASRKVLLQRTGYVAEKLGLVDGYRTRSMDKKMVDFRVFLKPGPAFDRAPSPPPPPPIPRGGFDPPRRHLEPISLWVGLNGNVVSGMWLKVLTAVTTIITTRPGIQNGEICRVLRPGITLAEVEHIVGWLVKRGAVEHRGDKEMGNWPTEDYFLAFKGSGFGPPPPSSLRVLGPGAGRGTGT